MIPLLVSKLKTLPKKTCVYCVIFIVFLVGHTKFKFINNILQKFQRANDHPHYHNETHEQIVFKNPNDKHLKDDIKTILFWTPHKYDPLYYLQEKGQKGFIKLKCKINNCYATDNRNLFGANITHFNAIVFNGQVFKQNNSWSLPKQRSEYQKYIFFETESSGQYPLCLDQLDNFFNWTMTYRLDSDIPCPFIVIRNKTGHKVGPKEGMVWHKSAESHFLRLSKKKAVAWFPFDCTNRRSAATTFSSQIKEALGTYKLDVDVYGDCGPLVCVRGNRECDYMKRDYFFVLALENSIAKDYVTDKVLVALQNNVVPIVYGGANYTSFLPPGSYVDGTIVTPEEIADIVVAVMENYVLLSNDNIYQKYFKWKSLYSFHKAKQAENLCALCAAVNDEKKMKQRKVYKYFRKWWNPDYREACYVDDDNSSYD